MEQSLSVTGGWRGKGVEWGEGRGVGAAGEGLWRGLWRGGLGQGLRRDWGGAHQHAGPQHQVSMVSMVSMRVRA